MTFLNSVDYQDITSLRSAISPGVTKQTRKQTRELALWKPNSPYLVAEIQVIPRVPNM